MTPRRVLALVAALALLVLLGYQVAPLAFWLAVWLAAIVFAVLGLNGLFARLAEYDREGL